MDCFAICIACGAQKNLKGGSFLKMALTFSVFHIIMITLGWVIGDTFLKLISIYDHWLAFGLLAGIGCKMLIESTKKQEEKSFMIEQWSVLLPLSIATSIDALVVGLGLGLENTSLWLVNTMMGLVIFFISFFGIYLGSKTTFLSAKKAELFGGVALILIGIKILYEHVYNF